jgi:aminoglycoside 3-N-acetyltransferase
MSEHDVLATIHSDAQTQHRPVTRESLVHDLFELGVRKAMTLLVHTSLSRLGWVLGGPQTVIEALLESLGPQGTLMMPAHSMQLTEPQYWRNPPVPESWWPTIRAQAPVFDKHLTPTRGMGCVAELFRTMPGALRSNHPHGSFAARGPNAPRLTAHHKLTDMFGEASPLGSLYDADGHVLLLGVDHGNNTSLHLAENRADFPGKRWSQQGARLITNNVSQWVEFADFETDASDFAALGEAFAAQTGLESRGPIGWGTGRLMRQRAVVDYGRQWLEKQRHG